MVYCVYLNPTVDKTMYFDAFEVGGTNRPNRVIQDGAGKAINVAVVLRALGCPVTVLGLSHGDAPIIEQRLKDAGIAYRFLSDDGETRVNTKIFDASKQEVTELNESGSVVAQSLIDEISELVYAQAGEGDTVVLTGSLPPGCVKDQYARMIAKLNAKGACCILDADGAALGQGVKQHPYLIKPNVDELRSVVDVPEDSIEAVAQACRKVVEDGVAVVAVSLGARGALIVDAQGAWVAQPLRVNVQSTVGAGDSMVAGMVSAIGKGAAQMLCTGVAAATGSITLPGTALCDEALFAEYLPQVKIEQIV